ncbi:SR-related and CTD-associated factor 8 isoform X1 [Xenopus laevis]|uniref:SR-related and CTD-associated factor 8 isoform X1 n=1 Tax=Xenopus laevis TaxID=8355 RepID=A0A8J1KUJ1_XENLA|nr:SR-related and CTD-associated factor 8 isoform X1 [Xenopus laevis]
MEAVKTFNSEGRHQGIEVPLYRTSQLFSLNDYKPPISKAKMTQITKSAIKAIKFYKHVVQSVEKFIQKCKPEYKVPGLYVIDSIVRQSRHQFGQDKDLFAPRFSNNIINTFHNLYRCPADEKSKIVRVLNLWQKNNVFKSEIIQPLLDMAAGIPPPVVTPVLPSTTAAMSNTPGTPVTPVTPANIVQGIPDPWIAQINNTDTLAAVAQILQSPQGQQLQQLVQSLHIQQQKPQPSLLQALDAGLVVQLQALTAQLTAAASSSNPLNQLEQSVSLSKKLMDRFDFGDDSNQPEDTKKETQQIPLIPESVNNSIFHQLAEHLQQQNLEHLRQQLLEQQHSTKVTAQENQDFMSESENSATPSQDDSQQPFLESESQMHSSMNMQQEDMEIEETLDENEEIFEKEEKKIMKQERPRTRSKSRSRSPRKRRSRSRSGSRKRKHRKRSRSRSRERKRKTSRSYSSERRAREREKERQKKGLPPIRSKTLSVCSTTLWVGQVDKKATQQDLTNVFEEFGQIESINMIPPRGCAYVCMVHRQDSYRALQKLSSSSCKIGSKIIKIAWALNKGVKTEYKQFWDVDLGVTYIPWEKVKVDDLEGFAEGGMIDQESVNNEWKAQKSSEAAAGAKEPTPDLATVAPTTIVTSAPTPVATTTAQSSVVQKNSAVISQPEAYTQPVAVLQIPVAPAVSLVPPAFPVSMAVPPPGYSAIPPPPFMRASFNPSQPPPGFIPPPLPPPAIPPPALSSALPAATQSTVTSNIGILGLQPPSPITASLPHVNIPTRMTGMPLLDVCQGLLSQTASARFTLLHPGIPPLPPPPRSMLPPGLIDIHPLPFPLGEMVSLPDRSLGVQSRLDSDTVNVKEKRQTVSSSSIQEGDQDYRFPPVENRQNSSKPSTEKHGSEAMPSAGNKEMQSVRITDESVQARNADDDHEPQDMAVVDSSESQEKSMEETSVAHLSSEELHKDERKSEADAFEGLRQPVQQGYDHKGTNILDAHDGQVRQPLNDKQFRGPTIDILSPFQSYPSDRDIFARPPLGSRDHFGMPYIETHDRFGRPSMENPFRQPILDGRNHYGRPPMDGRDHFRRPPPDIRENHGRTFVDIAGKQLHFPLEKPWGHQEDFDERPHHSFTGFQGLKGFHDERHHHGNFRQEHRNTPNWNRGFEQATHRDFDDRRHSWERQVDRDERDFDFRREVNGDPFERERQSDNRVPPQPQTHIFEYFPEATSTQNTSKPQVNGENTENSNQKETVSKSDDLEPCEQKETSVKEGEENDIKETETESQIVVESTDTEGT